MNTKNIILNLGILFLLSFILYNCGTVNSDDDDDPYELMPFELNLNAICTNSTTDEWTHLGLSEETVLSILVHPQNPQVIFAGTGFDFSAQRNGKIFRSLDCGDTWDKVYEGGHFRGLLLHPSEPYTFFAWDHNPTGALLRSTDGGTSWHLHSDGMHTDGGNRTSVLLIHPDNPRIMYAGTLGFGTGRLYKSINGGVKWGNITMNHWPHLASGAAAMFLHPDHPELLFHSADFNGTLSRSTDGGDSWSSLLYMDRAVRKFVLNPYNPDQIVGIIPRLGLLVSDDRGNEWSEKEVSDPPRRYRDLIFTENQLYIASDGAVLRTEDFQTFTYYNEGIDFGQTSEGHALTLPMALSIDAQSENLYLGHWLVKVENKLLGGVYVRKLE